MFKKTNVAFSLLAALAIVQVMWWAYLLIDQQHLISTLNPDYLERSSNFKRMILFEAAFFIFFWSLSLWFTYKSYKEQILLKKAHGVFLAAISHELKTPIANIRLCLETLERPNIDEEKKNIYLSRAHTATNTLLEQVEDILTLTSFDSLDQKKIKIRLKDLVHEQIKVFTNNHKVLPENIYFSMDEKIFIEAPALSSQLIVRNILDNAFKYSQKSKNKTVKILADQANGKTTLKVIDHGIGMSPEEISLVSKPFWRSDRVVEEALPGTGMGLTLAQEIAQKSKIQIEFDSAGINEGVEARIIWETAT